ncbi:hypothetical protein EI555_009801 [Monodon monoceros]|uniref:UBA domain-containing protein n=1 Tax=Monodon monoceros TaxID=40151 RepID=A0A4U1FGA2_MONMO|nr:hypothetical protein EI555_009801 [Monodon monoceros]
MILDHNDAGFEEKVKQLIDITGKNQDEYVIALHDCNGDVNRAVNVLLEGNPDMHSWEMVGKKKGVSGQKDGGQTESNGEGEENRDRDRDYSQRRGGPPRRGRGASHGREFRGQENGLDGTKSGGPSRRGTERGRRGRGRGRGDSEHLPVENVTITAGQRIDLASLLGKTLPSMGNDSSNLDPSQSPSVLQPLVFSNLKQSTISQPASGNMFSHHSMVSMLGKEVGDVSEAKGRSTTGSQFLEQFKTAQALAQLAAQHSQSGTTTTSSWDMGSTTQSLSLMQYDLKNPTDSTVHSPFTNHQPFTPSSTVMEVFLQEKPPTVATSTAAPPHPNPCSPLPSKSTSTPQMSPGSSDNQSSSPQPAQQKLKQQKKKASVTSKIPALAVEMPGSAHISGLCLQFGALQFGSESVLSDYESTPTTSTSSSQAPSSLYTSTASESSSTISSNQESSYQSGPIQSTTYTSQNNAQGPLYEQ